jgi:hypothetical protein
MWPFDIFSKLFNLGINEPTVNEKETAELVAMITPIDEDFRVLNIKLMQEIYELKAENIKLKAEILDLNKKINDIIPFVDKTGFNQFLSDGFNNWYNSNKTYNNIRKQDENIYVCGFNIFSSDIKISRNFQVIGENIKKVEIYVNNIIIWDKNFDIPNKDPVFQPFKQGLLFIDSFVEIKIEAESITDCCITEFELSEKFINEIKNRNIMVKYKGKYHVFKAPYWIKPTPDISSSDEDIIRLT